MDPDVMQVIRRGAGCISLLAILLATVAAAVAAAKNKREGRPPYGGLVLAFGWAGSALVALIYLALDFATPGPDGSRWIMLLASYLNTFMTLVIVAGVALLAPRKREAGTDG